MEKKIPTYPNIDDYAMPWGFDDWGYQFDLEKYMDWKEEQKAINAVNEYSNNMSGTTTMIYSNPKRFIIDTEWNTEYWSFLPEINWNRRCYEIEFRWLCAGIMIRDDKKWFEKKHGIKSSERKWNYWTQWMH